MAMDAQTTAAQLGEARKERWHQAANPVLSIEALREWVNRSGLVLFGARAAQLGAPAPSLIEAGGGDEAAAKSLLARLVSEGGAVPLNLLGAAGGMGSDVPDFVASAGVFSYVFTLRGNKAWKQAPATNGAVKVSPLALAVYEMLAAKVTMSSYDLATQMGGGVSEAAVLRALSELWAQLRVIPVAQQDGSATLWELSTARFYQADQERCERGSALGAECADYPLPWAGDGRDRGRNRVVSLASGAALEGARCGACVDGGQAVRDAGDRRQDAAARGRGDSGVCGGCGCG